MEQLDRRGPSVREAARDTNRPRSYHEPVTAFRQVDSIDKFTHGEIEGAAIEQLSNSHRSRATEFAASIAVLEQTDNRGSERLDITAVNHDAGVADLTRNSTNVERHDGLRKCHRLEDNERKRVSS